MANWKRRDGPRNLLGEQSEYTRPADLFEIAESLNRDRERLSRVPVPEHLKLPEVGSEPYE